MFSIGKLTVSPGYFMQSHEWLADHLKASATRKVPEVPEWLQQTPWLQEFLARVLQVVHPSLHDACSQTLSAMGSTPDLQAAASRWPAIFEVIELIINHDTP
ncbi:hypothetical protein PAXRUDRAFT_20379 [Paxillus rubicundulus Ve08.2h10]|uniref:Uncharacterized protein n=1 Tax=Paxillus rubicundulus Ve08.2h10 TaxID=930991 RepID=A0A0D0BQY5_9AGAM|nr:hypothetical protein PAXRUDRAFT_20379 [Paxillus rubicundulus Ve08.2h10]